MSSGCSKRPSRKASPILSISFRGVAEAALYCAHRTSTFLSCAFCEQEGHLAAPPSLLADFFSILLLALEKVEMIRGSSSVTDCQAMAKGLGEIGFSCLHGIIHRFTSCEMGGDG